MIHGNLEGIRAQLLKDMEALYAMEFDGDHFAPPELVTAMAKYTGMIRREISVYISRDGDVLDVSIGDSGSVPLPEIRLRRSLDRLCGVRCLHTHPDGNPELSDVDLNALVKLRLDAIAAIGVLGEKATGIHAAFLGERENGVPTPQETALVPIQRIPQAEWMARIEESDRLLVQTGGDDAVDRPERALLVGIESVESLRELASLAETAGAEVVDVTMQKREKPDNATYVGLGKAQSIALDVQGENCDMIIVDDELTGVQTRNLEEIVGVKVIDRTTLILDIFTQRAKTREGKLQVEMAQLSYQLPRLIGEGISLSRLGGGIGTRGPGETKLEISRRRIRKRLSDLRAEVADLAAQRTVQRKRRQKNAVPVVALVGYTNTGKSTLLNALSNAGVPAEDKLFMTLDPVMRRVSLPDGGEFLLVDTVGFIRKLPHTLVDAFRSTLEEAALADLLLIVSDASNDDFMQQRETVMDVLGELGAGDKPMLDVLNKVDRLETPPHAPGAICISASERTGLNELLKKIGERIFAAQKTVTLMIPYAKGNVLSDLHANATVLGEEYETEGTRVKVRLERARLDRALSVLGAGALIEEQ